MSLELINNLLELSEKHMNEGEYNQVAMLLKEKYKIIDDVDYETLLIVPPIEIFTSDADDGERKLFTVKAFKYKKSLKNGLCNGNSRYLDGEFIFQVREQEHYIKLQSFHCLIKTIIENELSINMVIENSFYGKVKKFNILEYISLYEQIDYVDDECDKCFLFNTYVKTQFTEICEKTIRETILLLFIKM
jgi:hypothetical protein